MNIYFYENFHKNVETMIIIILTLKQNEYNYNILFNNNRFFNKVCI